MLPALTAEAVIPLVGLVLGQVLEQTVIDTSGSALMIEPVLMLASTLPALTLSSTLRLVLESTIAVLVTIALTLVLDLEPALEFVLIETAASVLRELLTQILELILALLTTSAPSQLPRTNPASKLFLLKYGIPMDRGCFKANKQTACASVSV